MTLHASFTALATFQPGDLFAFAVPLRNFPAEAAPLLCGLGGSVRKSVGDDPIRAVGRHLNPKTLHLVVFRNAFALDPLAVRECMGAPRERVHTLIRALTARISHLTGVCEWAGVVLLQGCNAQQQVFGRVPRLPQHCPKWQLRVVNEGAQHLADVIALGFAIPFGVVEAVVSQPALVDCGIDVDARHDADPFDDAGRVAAVLPSHQLDGERGVFVQHRVIKNDEALRRQRSLSLHVVPNEARGDPFATQITIDQVMGALLTLVGKVRQRIVDLTDQEILAGISSCHRGFHAHASIAFSMIRRL